MRIMQKLKMRLLENICFAQLNADREPEAKIATLFGPLRPYGLTRSKWLDIGSAALLPAEMLHIASSLFISDNSRFARLWMIYNVRQYRQMSASLSTRRWLPAHLVSDFLHLTFENICYSVKETKCAGRVITGLWGCWAGAGVRNSRGGNQT